MFSITKNEVSHKLPSRKVEELLFYTSDNKMFMYHLRDLMLRIDKDMIELSDKYLELLEKQNERQKTN